MYKNNTSHFNSRHPNPPVLQSAKQLAINLIQTMQSELQSYIQQQPPPVQSQQVIPQPQIQQIQQGNSNFIVLYFCIFYTA